MANKENMSNSAEKLNQLERSLLELGTEIFRLRTDICDLKRFNQDFVDVMKGLKIVLDDKGLISSEDFENVVDLSQAIIHTNSPNIDPHFDSELDRIKKLSH